MLGPSSGSTLTPPAASAVTNSLRQATSWLPPVIRHRLRMNQYPEQLRRIVFEANLERCLNVVHSRKRHIVGQRAMAGNIQPRAHLLELEFVHVHHLGK